MKKLLLALILGLIPAETKAVSFSVVLDSGTQTINGTKTFVNPIVGSISTATFASTASGSGIIGQVSSSVLPSTVAYISVANTFSSSQTFNNGLGVIGNVGIGTLSPQYSLDIATGNLSAISISSAIDATRFSGTDIGVQITNALNSFGPAPKCGTVFIPIGIYPFTNPVRIDQRVGCIIEGQGDNTVLRYTVNSSSGAFMLDRAQQWKLRGFNLDCEGACDVVTSTGAAGINDHDSGNGEISDIEFSTWPTAAIRMYGETGSPVVPYMTSIHNNMFIYNLGTGIYGNFIHGIKILQNTFQAGSSYAIYLQNANSTDVDYNEPEGGAAGQILADGFTGGSISHNHVEQTGGFDGITVGTVTASYGLAVIGNAISADGTYCIDIGAGLDNYGLVVQGNSCQGGAKYAVKVDCAFDSVIGPNIGIDANSSGVTGYVDICGQNNILIDTTTGANFNLPTTFGVAMASVTIPTTSGTNTAFSGCIATATINVPYNGYTYSVDATSPIQTTVAETVVIEGLLDGTQSYMSQSTMSGSSGGCIPLNFKRDIALTAGTHNICVGYYTTAGEWLTSCNGPTTYQGLIKITPDPR